MFSVSKLPKPVKRVLRNTRNFLWHRLDDEFLVLDLQAYSPPRGTAPDQLALVEADNPLDIIDRIDPNFHRPAVQFIRCGYRMLVYREDGHDAGYIWFHDSSTTIAHPTLERFGVQLDQGEIYLFMFCVSPEFQARHVSGPFFAAVLEKFRDDGYQRGYGFVECSNIPARWTYIVHGWKTTQRITGQIFLNSFAVTNVGLLINNTLAGLIDKTRRGKIGEFLPLRRRIGAMSTVRETGDSRL